MSDADKAVVRAYIEAAAAQDWDAADALHGLGWRQHNSDGSTLDPTVFREQITQFFVAFPDLTSMIHDQVAEPGKVATHLTWSGTHQGEFLDIPATGRQVDFEVVRFDRVEDGKLAETRVVFDAATVTRQLGVGS